MHAIRRALVWLGIIMVQANKVCVAGGMVACDEWRFLRLKKHRFTAGEFRLKLTFERDEYDVWRWELEFALQRQNETVEIGYEQQGGQDFRRSVKRRDLPGRSFRESAVFRAWFQADRRSALAAGIEAPLRPEKKLTGSSGGLSCADERGESFVEEKYSGGGAADFCVGCADR